MYLMAWKGVYNMLSDKKNTNYNTTVSENPHTIHYSLGRFLTLDMWQIFLLLGENGTTELTFSYLKLSTTEI